MPTYPNQFDASTLPYTHSGTLDQSNTNQTGQPENYITAAPSYNDAQGQFFVTLTPGVTYEFDLQWATGSPMQDWIIELVVFRLTALGSYKWYRIIQDVATQLSDHNIVRWTVPAGVDPATRLAIVLAGLVTPPVVNYTLSIAQVTGGSGSGSRYRAY